jgi:nucleobase:cation symporter-1, NCS1 family
MKRGAAEVSSLVEKESLSGRLPVLPTERVYKTYGSFLWTMTAFGAATWSFLIGGYLPMLGDWRTAVVGFLVGVLTGMPLVALVSGAPSYKYGTDVIDTAKSSYGNRGVIILLLGLMFTLVGWTYVVEALTSRGAANLATYLVSGHMDGQYHERLVIIVANVALLLVWLIASKGPKLFERFNAYIGPFHVVITVVMLAILEYRYGLHHLWVSQFPPEKMITHDRLQGFVYAVELGVSSSLTWWPVMGGLTRLIQHKRHLVGPTVVGAGFIGAGCLATVAALSAISAGTSDPTIWMLALAGPIVGSAVMSVVLAANIATMVIMVYLACISVQQVKALAAIRWEVLVALAVAPGILFSFHTQWVLNSTVSWLSYNGVMFVGVTGIMLSDYFILRKEVLNPVYFFSGNVGQYAYWGGVNWVAVVVTAVSAAGYLYLYDPVSFKAKPAFFVLGASIPTILFSAVAYYVAARWILAPLGKGGYAGPLNQATNISVSDAVGENMVRVGL